ncbi:MAG: hypothetical protein KF781_10075 [Chitinophagaceae bacterium]|nr:hypothetical protein [Chitinophagaceae bacterium]MCW5904600.1 hypothetical protein [Chitinophagaceae bacterium]
MKNERFKSICHFAAGVIFLLIAFKMFEQKKFALCIVLLLTGILFVFISSSLEWLEKTIGSSAKLAFLLESIALGAVSFIYIEQGNKKLTIIFVLAALIYFLLFIYFLYYKGKRKKRHKKHRSSHH